MIKTIKKLIAKLSIVAILVTNIATPYSIIYAQEASASATISPTQEITPTQEPTSIPTPTIIVTSSPTVTPTQEVTPTITITPTVVAVSPTLAPRKEFKKEKKQSKATITEKKRKYVEGEVLVTYKTNKISLKNTDGKDKSNDIAKKYSYVKKEDIKVRNTSVFEIKNSDSVEDAIAKLKQDPSVESAQPNYQYAPMSISTNDTYKNSLWGLDNTGQTVNGVMGTTDADIDAPEAWTLSEGSGVIVAVIDSGVQYTHPDLSANMWNGSACKDENNVTISGGCLYGYDYEENDNDPKPVNELHGTHVAGTIAAAKNNNEGVVGVAPQTKIMALKSSLITSELIKAIAFAQNNGAKVINASWGGYYNDAQLQSAISSYNGIFIAAAGNDTINNDGVNKAYPCSYTLAQIVCVASTTSADGLSSFSNYGATSVDVGAPGSNILSTGVTFSEGQNSYETFDSLTPPAIPAGYTKTGNWGTGDASALYGGGWERVLYGDVTVPYSANVNSTITSPTINMSGRTGATFNFWTICDTEYTAPGASSDYMALEVSSDGSTFTEVSQWNEYSIDAAVADTDPSDVSGEYKSIAIPNAKLTSNFKYRLRWVSDASDNGTSGYGCLVDDVELIYSTISSTNAYEYLSGTSMAAPHVSGVAALVYSMKTSFTAAEVKDIILTSGDTISSLNGKTETGKRVNLYNATVKAYIKARQPNFSAYRFYRKDASIHFYTASESEIYNILANDRLNNWVFEGVAYNAFSSSNSLTIPLYRFYRTDAAVHFYTASETEKNSIIANGGSTWNFEGIAYYVFPTYTEQTSKNVYRFYRTDAKIHFYTASETEKDAIITNGGSTWRFEGPAWKVPN